MALVLAKIAEASNAFQFAGGSGVSAADVVIQTGDATRFDEFMLMSTAGAMQVFASIDGTNYATAPLSLVDLGATSSAPVTVTAAGRIYAFFGIYAKVQVQQSGATAVANASMNCSKKGGQR